jgi:phage terminase small subunit
MSETVLRKRKDRTPVTFPEKPKKLARPIPRGGKRTRKAKDVNWIDRPLTIREQRFIEEYPKDLDGTRAVLAAGYSPNGAAVTACVLLKRPKIQRALSGEFDKRRKRVEVDQDQVLGELAKLAFFDPRKVFTAQGNVIGITDIDETTAKAISSFTITEQFNASGDLTRRTRISFWNKRGALVDLGNHLGLFNKNDLVPGDGVNVEINVLPPTEGGKKK